MPAIGYFYVSGRKIMLYQSALFLYLLDKVVMYRTSMCLRKNEQFSMCGWRCPPTCVNMKMLSTGL